MPGAYKRLHHSAVGSIDIRRDDLHGTPYAEIAVQQGREIVTLHLGAATLMSVAAGLIEASKDLQFGRGANAAANNAHVRTKDAEAL